MDEKIIAVHGMFPAALLKVQKTLPLGLAKCDIVKYAGVIFLGTLETSKTNHTIFSMKCVTGKRPWVLC